ncbi:NAD(P)-binding protein [Acaromyces ingoldii]|uniref:NAD(P)-binding protein n=1 Tax=Acaromyces ingoldii TaxID=215250 RepID=A0A316YXR2_9BASI|nr:NAD(P)-binding protein [Acaromyces ingoldii]PWN92605.1 NAD(P)-binding protein [Acaromyces ingoldii]
MSLTDTFANVFTPTHHDVYDFIDPSNALKGSAKGRKVLITGAGTGIGRGIALSFARAGAESLVLVARRREPLEETRSMIQSSFGEQTEVLVCSGVDISDPSAVDELFASDALRSRPADVLVSNAGVALSRAPVQDSDPSLWWSDFEINTKGPYLLCRAFLRARRAAMMSSSSSLQAHSFDRSGRPGYIINVTTNTTRYQANMSSYSGSKNGLNILTEAIEAEQKGDVHAYALHPGGVAGTGLTGENIKLPPKIAALMVDKPELAGATCVWLCTEKAHTLGGRYLSATWDMQKVLSLSDSLEDDSLKTRVSGVTWAM